MKVFKYKIIKLICFMVGITLKVSFAGKNNISPVLCFEYSPDKRLVVNYEDKTITYL